MYLAGNLTNGSNSVSIMNIAKVQSLADYYDNTSTYAIDDIVSYQGQLYSCHTAVTTAEDFDSSKWTEINMVSYVQSFVTSSITTALNTPV